MATNDETLKKLNEHMDKERTIRTLYLWLIFVAGAIVGWFVHSFLA